MKNWFYRRSAGISGLARSVAQTYQSVGREHPEFSHQELLEAVLNQRAEIHARLIGGYDSFSLERVVKLVRSEADLGLSDLAFSLAQMENPRAFALMPWEDRTRILQTIREQIIELLGNDPPHLEGESVTRPPNSLDKESS